LKQLIKDNVLSSLRVVYILFCCQFPDFDSQRKELESRADQLRVSSSLNFTDGLTVTVQSRTCASTVVEFVFRLEKRLTL